MCLIEIYGNSRVIHFGEGTRPKMYEFMNLGEGDLAVLEDIMSGHDGAAEAFGSMT